jgi:hypothetical protein
MYGDEDYVYKRKEQRSRSTMTSAFGITSFCLGAAALVTAPIPIINYFSFFVAIVGVVVSVLEYFSIAKGSKANGVFATLGLILCVLSISFATATQVIDGNKTTSDNPVEAQECEAVNLGVSVPLPNGLTLTVDSIDTNYIAPNGETLTSVSVTYQNDGTRDVSFNLSDWRGRNTDNDICAFVSVSTANDGELRAGVLSPGDSISGTVYFPGTLVQVMYYAPLVSAEPSVCWTAS